MISWEAVRLGIRIAKLEHDGIDFEPNNNEIGDTLIAIYKSMESSAVELQFNSLMKMMDMDIDSMRGIEG